MKLKDLDDDTGQGPDLGDEDETDLDAVVYASEEFLEYLGELIEEDHVQYARETLEGIYETVETRGKVTEAQRQAVVNIDEGGQRGRHGRHRRGY